MMLEELVDHLSVKETRGALGPSLKKRPIVGLAYDSRQVKKDFVFFALPGQQADGHRYLVDAEKNGAVAAVVAEASPGLKIPQLVVEKTRRALGQLAARFHGHPSSRLRVIGITGTNGKTTQTYLLESILTAAGRIPGVIGTVNYRYPGWVGPASHTTPESLDLQVLLARMQTAGVTDVVMEVSSHALDQDRVEGVQFDAGVFTNLTQDHLDYHKNLEDYFRSKTRLFSRFLRDSEKKKRFAVINMQDPRADAVVKASAVPVVRVGKSAKNSEDVFCESQHLGPDGIEAVIRHGSKKMAICSRLIGGFNLDNILLAVAVASRLEISEAAIIAGIAACDAVPGRLERIPNNRGLHIFVDYAHTPDALARVGENLRPMTKGRVITVFGCGGDRDKTKRPLMGREAAGFSDEIFVTSDNPRKENPETILSDILPGLSGFDSRHVYRVVDRREAIRRAVELAQPGDIVLVAGKGHEDYQIIGDRKTPFSDQKVLRDILGGSKKE